MFEGVKRAYNLGAEYRMISQTLSDERYADENLTLEKRQEAILNERKSMGLIEKIAFEVGDERGLSLPLTKPLI